MGAFIVAIIILCVGLVLAFVCAFGNMMRTVPDPDDRSALWTLAFFVVLAVIVAGTHWLPRIGW